MDQLEKWKPDQFGLGRKPDPECIVGRDVQIDSLMNLVQDPDQLCAVVRSSPGMGKSSIFNTIEKSRDDIAYLDVAAHLCIDLGENEEGIINGIKEEVAFELGEELDEALDKDLFLDLLPRLCSEYNERLLIVLDEIYDLDQDSYEALIEALTKGSQKLEKPPFWIISISETWDDLKLETKDGIKQIRLDRMEKDDLEALLTDNEKLDFTFTEEAIQRLYDLTAGYPMFFKVILTAVYDERWKKKDKESPISEAEIDEAAERVSSEKPWMQWYLQRIYYVLRENSYKSQRVIYTLSQADRALDFIELKKLYDEIYPHRLTDRDIESNLSALVESGIVCEDNGRYSVAIPLLKPIIINNSPWELF